MNFGYVSLTGFHITFDNFQDDCTEFHVYNLEFFFENGIFKNIRKIWKKSNVFTEANEFDNFFSP